MPCAIFFILAFIYLTITRYTRVHKNNDHNNRTRALKMTVVAVYHVINITNLNLVIRVNIQRTCNAYDNIIIYNIIYSRTALRVRHYHYVT